ncbi:DNA-binding protein [Rhizobium leguminosarum]|nr:DNA-binding protein [Rhizobium leguminosarum]
MHEAENQSGKVDRLLAPEDAAILLGPPGRPIPIATLQYWRYRRRGPKFIKMGRHVYYRESALQDFIRRGEVEVAEVSHA